MRSKRLYEGTRFGLEGSKIPKFCREHAKQGMVDIVSVRCG